LFQQVKQSRVFQDVIDQIQEAILQGKLKVGDRLPAERELKEILGTSRGTLREALRVLEQKGLITIKTGVAGGPIVSSVPPQKVSESLALLIRSQKVPMRHLSEFREGVEGIVSGLAAERATSEDIVHLNALLSEAGECLEQGVSRWDEFIGADNKIHMYLAHIAGNPVYELVLDTVHENINRYYDRLLPRRDEIMEENYRDLCEIVEAVELGQADRARSIAQDHVRRFNLFME